MILLTIVGFVFVGACWLAVMTCRQEADLQVFNPNDRVVKADDIRLDTEPGANR